MPIKDWLNTIVGYLVDLPDVMQQEAIIWKSQNVKFMG